MNKLDWELGIRVKRPAIPAGRLRVLIFLIVVLGIAASAVPVCSASYLQPQAPNVRTKIVLVVANRLTLSDLDDPTLPNITRLLKFGNIGLISPNCRKPRTEEAVMLTAATGASSPGGPWLREFYDAGETVPATREIARDAYATRTGRRAPLGSAVFLGLAQAVRAVDESGVLARVGDIGDALRCAGVRTCVVGNADLTTDDPSRAASVLVADSRGLIDVGRISVSLGPSNACGLSWSSKPLATTAIRSLRDADLVVVNFGDSTRLDEIKISLSDTAYQAHRRAVMMRLDDLVGRLAATCDRYLNAELILVSFSPPRTGYWNRLTPIAVLRRNQEPGLLTSSTTRTPGLIAASDFPRVVLWTLGIHSANSGVARRINPFVQRYSEYRAYCHSERSEESRCGVEILRYTSGDAKVAAQDYTKTSAKWSAKESAQDDVEDKTQNAVTAGVQGIGNRGFEEKGVWISGFVDSSFKSAERCLDVLREMDKRVEANHTLILPMLWVFAVIAATSLTASALFVAFGWPLSRRVGFALRTGILLSASACLAMLLAVLGPPGVASYAVMSLVLVFLIALVSVFLAGKSALLVIFAVTVLAIVLDAITGCKLCKFALPSSYQLEGYRYYGVGNEYAAALITMSALIGMFQNPKTRASSVLVLGVVTTVILGLGALGSNYGATAAAVVTFGLILIALRSGKFGVKHVVGLVLLGGFVSTALAGIDWFVFRSTGTHGAAVFGTGLQGALAVVGRKMLMNAELASSRDAQQAVMAILPFVALWFWRIRPKLSEMLCKDDRLNAALKALIVGSVAALVMNDSGIVMAGIMVSMTILTLMYDLLWRETNAKDSGA
ncbi:MAG: hypothetical protein N3B12_05570 [Armatimonadetes bacterium]|nr:hypothetical protein [Armatimonadota bacterium]